MQPATPILAYASDRTSAGRRIQWREEGDGRFELVVPPPAMWRLLIGPALALALLTPLLLFAVIWMLMMFIDSMVGGCLALGVVAAGISAWSGVLIQIVRTARGGRKPFTLTADGRGLRIIDPRDTTTPAAAAGVLQTERVTFVRLFPLQLGFSYGLARLLIKFEDGQVISSDIPLHSDQALQPIEDWLQAVFAITPVPCASTEGQCAS